MEHRYDVTTCDEAECPVNRIEYPEETLVVSCADGQAEFLAKDAVVGVAFQNGSTQLRFDFEIGFCDRTLVRLVDNLDFTTTA